MKQVNVEEISLVSLVANLNIWFKYVLSKWLIIATVVVLASAIGFIYSLYQKPVYTAELTFASDSEGSGSVSAYAGLAAQFGISLGAGSSNAFEGENLMQLMSSRKLIQNTLMTSVSIEQNNDFLINYYIKAHKIYKHSENTDKNKEFFFLKTNMGSDRTRDSILRVIYLEITDFLTIEKLDKKSDLISVKFKDTDEIFAKLFVEELVNNVIQYYTEYKIKKTKQNVLILQRQTDSVRSLINGNIVDIAVSNDLNINPTRQIVRTGVQRKQVDAQVNSALYTELVKNLELSKLSLRKETPLIQIIDTPILPLEKKKLGKLKGLVVFGFIGLVLAVVFYTFKVIFSNKNSVKD